MEKSNSIITATVILVTVFFIGLIYFANKKEPAAQIQKEDTEMAVVQKKEETNLDKVDLTDLSTGAAKKRVKPEMTIDQNKTYLATVDTSEGTFVLKLDAENKPVTVNNFVALANDGFYNGTIFHRVIDGFMIQGGDPLGNGTGGPGYQFEDEVSAPNVNAKGTIAMANAGAGTNGSQFFVNLADNNFLDTKHTVFGEVTKGMDVVEKIGKTQVTMSTSGENSRPVKDVVVNKIEVSAE